MLYLAQVMPSQQERLVFGGWSPTAISHSGRQLLHVSLLSPDPKEGVRAMSLSVVEVCAVLSVCFSALEFLLHLYQQFHHRKDEDEKK